jgi:WhiB family transcriptional regulator, redox-sensing transcriptional regulator
MSGFLLPTTGRVRQDDIIVISTAAFGGRKQLDAPRILGEEAQPMREMLMQLEVDAQDRRWQERANCLGVDPDLFFPERGASTKEAKGVCGGCEVRLECLEYALRHGEKFGIWGGMSERERRRLRRQRALARRGLASA